MRRVLVSLVAVLALALVVACQAKSAGDPALERITLGPREAHRPVGQAQRFTATGHYTDGSTRNLTQRVEYISSDPKVAGTANVKGDRSRVDALAPGRAVISARDPKTGVSSHDGDGKGDATLTVMGALERLTLSPSLITRNVGQTQRLTATGHYADGATRNITQHVEYRSSNPGVAVMANAKGDKSRIDLVGTGSATISAVDAATGITSSTTGGDASVTVVPAKPD